MAEGESKWKGSIIHLLQSFSCRMSLMHIWVRESWAPFSGLFLSQWWEVVQLRAETWWGVDAAVSLIKLHFLIIHLQRALPLQGVENICRCSSWAEHLKCLSFIKPLDFRCSTSFIYYCGKVHIHFISTVSFYVWAEMLMCISVLGFCKSMAYFNPPCPPSPQESGPHPVPVRRALPVV